VNKLRFARKKSPFAVFHPEKASWNVIAASRPTITKWLKTDDRDHEVVKKFGRK
jgi:hypothetical protein